MAPKLESFDAPKSGQEATFETDEVTAKCPFSYGSGRDFYTLTIRYKTDDLALESKSLRDWIRSLDNKEITAEELAHLIHTRVESCIEPTQLYIKLEQNIRGGITEIVEEGDNVLRR